MPASSSLCSHIINIWLVLPKLKVFKYCRRKFFPNLGIITGSICTVGSWPWVFSLYLSLSLSLSLRIFLLQFCTVVFQHFQALSFTSTLQQGFPQLDSKHCKDLPACFHFKHAIFYLYLVLHLFVEEKTMRHDFSINSPWFWTSTSLPYSLPISSFPGWRDQAYFIILNRNIVSLLR